MTFYATGEGLTDGPNVAGIPAQAPYPHPLLPIVVDHRRRECRDPVRRQRARHDRRDCKSTPVVPGGFVAPGEAAVELTLGTAKAPPITIWLK